MKYPPHILVIRLSALGDIAMTVPVIKALAKQYPHVQITMLSRPFVKPLFNEMPANVHFMAVDIKGEHKGISGLNELFRRLHAKHFTAVADLHDVLRTKYLRARFIINRYPIQHIDKHRKQRKQLLRHNGEPPAINSQFQNYADVFRKLGYPIQLSPPSPSSPLTSSPATNKIGIAPFAAHKGKIYPIEKMENIVRQLSQHPQTAHIYFFCGKGEETEIVDRWCKQYPNTTNASKQCGSLEKELQLMKQLRLMLSMDSANAHLAATQHIPVVTIWGATHPCAGFKAWQQQNEDCIQADMPCRPCSIYGNRPCKTNDYACLHQIKEETIIQHIIRKLS